MARVLFGPFEFDCATLELRRAGVSVRLQSQPAQVLRALVERADQIISREELRQSVWGDSTFVDFESGLNFCISQLRSALHDSASESRYIRTVPRQGYQFVAPVRVLDGPAAPTYAVSEARAGAHRRWLYRVAIPVAAALLLVLGGLGTFLHIRNLHAAPPIVGVARFDNETGNPAFDRFASNLTDDVVGRLADWSEGKYRVVGNAKVLFVPRGQRDLRTIATTLHASYIVLGQVQSSGDQVRVLAHLIRASDQTHIWVIRLEGPEAVMAQRETQIASQIEGTLWSRLAADPEHAPSFKPGSR